MLDLDHPQSAHVFAAAKQLDMVRDAARRMTREDARRRIQLLEIVRPCFAALRWLQAQHFADQPALATMVDELAREVEKLAHLADGADEAAAGDGPRARCPACGARLTDGTVYLRFFRRPTAEWWCCRCLAGVWAALDRVELVEEGFGTDAI
jgi:hypothetical protein